MGLAPGRDQEPKGVGGAAGLGCTVLHTGPWVGVCLMLLESQPDTREKNTGVTTEGVGMGIGI